MRGRAASGGGLWEYPRVADLTYCLVDPVQDRVIAPRVRRAGSLRERLVGLMGRRSLEPGEGLWLVPCNGIHTVGMRIPIDVIVLDRQGRVLRICRSLRPWRMILPSRGGHSTVELRAGTLDGASVQVGDRLALERQE